MARVVARAGTLGLCGAGRRRARGGESISVATQAIIYGQDDRVEIYESPDVRLRALASSSFVALIPRSHFARTASGDFAIFTRPLKDAFQVCADARFANQPTAADCSGVLIDDDLVLTAGHCFTSDDACERFAFMFDYFFSGPGDLEPMGWGDVYGCRRIVSRQVTTDATSRASTTPWCSSIAAPSDARRSPCAPPHWSRVSRCRCSAVSAVCPPRSTPAPTCSARARPAATTFCSTPIPSRARVARACSTPTPSWSASWCAAARTTSIELTRRARCPRSSAPWAMAECCAWGRARKQPTWRVPSRACVPAAGPASDCAERSRAAATASVRRAKIASSARSTVTAPTTRARCPVRARQRVPVSPLSSPKPARTPRAARSSRPVWARRSGRARCWRGRWDSSAFLGDGYALVRRSRAANARARRAAASAASEAEAARARPRAVIQPPSCLMAVLAASFFGSMESAFL